MRRLIAVGLLWAMPAFGVFAAEEGSKDTQPAEEAEDPKIAHAKGLIVQYLDLVRKKKWADANKLVHPKTLQLIAEMKKRNKEAHHNMAPQDAEKNDFYLKEYRVDEAEPAVNDTVVVSAREDNWQVEQKGIAENEPASYLLGVFKNRWYVVDKMQNGKFNEDGIKIGHKGYFDEESPPKSKAPEKSEE